MSITKWEKSMWKGPILYVSTMWHCEKGKTIEIVKVSGIAGRSRGKNRQSTKSFKGSETIQCDTILGNTYLYIFVQNHTTPRVNPSINSGLCIIIMWQCSFICCSRCTPWWGCWQCRELWVCGGRERMGNLYLCSVLLWTKTPLKYNLFNACDYSLITNNMVKCLEFATERSQMRCQWRTEVGSRL